MLALASVRWNFKSASPSQSGKLSAGPDRCCHRSETHEEDKTCHADWTHSEAARRTDENQANLLSVVVGLKDVADESAVTAPACWLQNETKQPLVVLMRRTLKHSGEGELQKERGGGQGEGGDDKSLENCQRLKPEQRSRDHLTLSRVTCVWGSMSLKRKKYKHRYQRVAKNYKSRNSFSFLPFQFLCFNLWQWYVVSDPLNNDGPALLCVTKYSSHNDNLTQNTQTHTHTHSVVHTWGSHRWPAGVIRSSWRCCGWLWLPGSASWSQRWHLLTQQFSPPWSRGSERWRAGGGSSLDNMKNTAQDSC